MIRILWKPIVGVMLEDDHTCGNCINSLKFKGERAVACAQATAVTNEDGTVTVTSPCSGLSNTYPEYYEEDGKMVKLVLEAQ